MAGFKTWSTALAVVPWMVASLAVAQAGPAAAKHKPTPPDSRLIDEIREIAGEVARDATDTRPAIAFEFTIDGFAPGEQDPGGGLWPYGRIDPKRTAVAISADGTAAWITADLDIHAMFEDGTPGYVSPIVSRAHGVVLADLAFDASWNAFLPTSVAANIGVMLDAKAEAQAIAADPPAELEPSVASDAQPAVDRFRASLGDPAKLAATLSARKDVTLLGSAPGERYAGAAVRGQLARWGLAFAVRDGVRAGVTKGKTVAWVAANLDARPAASPKAKATPYRALFLYEQTGASWQLVYLSFTMIDAQIREHH